MKNIRIYKDDIRVHILRSLFFTDTILVVSGGLAIAGTLFLFFQYTLHSFNIPYYLSSLIVSLVLFFTVITHRVDNQPIYKVVPRAVTFKSKKKEHLTNKLEPYFVDFTIKDNLIYRKNALIGIYEIKPFDIALLNEQDREHFFLKLKQVIHTLPSQIQLIVRKEPSKIEDYSRHIFSIYENSSKGREPLIKQYVENLSDLVSMNNFMITKHYAVLSVPCQTNNPYSVVESIKRLNDIGNRFASALSLCNILVRNLEDNELKSFTKGMLR